jgi:DNA polymerase-1
MIATRENFDALVERFSVSGLYGLDTETTGLSLKDRLFSIILSDDQGAVYFNFNDEPDHLGNCAPEEQTIPRSWFAKMEDIFANTTSIFAMHNAKFDMRMLSNEDLYVAGSIHCTEAAERVLRNNLLGYKPYSLASCAERRGLRKDDRVEEYIKKHKLYQKVQIPGKDKPAELRFYNKVPFPIISEYGLIDGIIVRKIAQDQMLRFHKHDTDKSVAKPPILPLLENERRLTKVCFRIERQGIRINRPYIEGALSYTLDAAAKAKQSFEALTQIPYENSPTIFKKAFEKFGIELPKTRTGQPCTNKQVLDELENPVADKIREIRSLEKLASTYYSSFLHFADEDDFIYANMRQAGTETGRFSYSDPNLQNLPKEDEPEDREKKYIVRRSFIPASPEFCLVPIDFKQQEFRMMLDYAGEHELIAAVMGGLDVHEGTAQLVGTMRKFAKTLNFGLLYGMGGQKLAKALKIPLEDAMTLRARYFQKLPNVLKFIKGVIATGENRGYIWNWFGFTNYISDREYAYVLPNHLIQGGCAQVLRVAMVRLDEYIREKRLRSSMLAQVHDELLFQVHRCELQHVPAFQKIMENVYKPKNGMYLHCSVEHSWKSWGKFDMIAGNP